MTASKFTDAHKALILKQSADDHAVAEIYRKTRISEMAYFNCKKKCD